VGPRRETRGVIVFDEPPRPRRADFDVDTNAHAVGVAAKLWES
jgi:hypothetical protein